jgi:type VI secretion system secreted protein VgrG
MATLPNIDEQFASEIGDHRRMLAVEFGSRQAELRPPDRSFLPCRLDLTESLSTPFRAVVHGLTPDLWCYPHDSVPGDRDVEPHPDRFLGLPTKITIRSEGRVRLMHGVVTRARHLGNWFSEPELAGFDAFELVVEAPLRLLDLRRASRVYQERTTRQILHELLEEHLFTNRAVGATLRATFPNERHDDYPARACRMQYQETDLDFIQRLLIDEGLNYVLEAEAGHSGFGNAWHVFGADHDFGKTHDAILNTAPGRGELELLNWHGHRQMVPAYTYAVSHDYKDNARYEGTGRGRENIGMGATGRGAFGSYESLSPRAVKKPSTGMDAPASHRQWAHDMEAEAYDGETIAPLTLAKPIRVLGLETARTPLRTSEEPNERDDDYIVTAQTIVATAPPRAEMRQRWASLVADVRSRAGVDLFPPEDDDTRPLRVRFTAHPRRSRIVPPHPRHARRPVPGAMTATVVGGEGAIVETDELGRIAVVFHWERKADVPQFAMHFPKFPRPPTRVRYVHPGAGQGVGMQYLPRVGDEVLILFIDNDPDRPIAVGSVHNGELGTPSFGGVSSLPKDAALTGMRTGEHKGGGANEMVFDDTTGEVGLRLGSTTAATDLSLGHITTPRNAGKATLRGAGAELRTDGAAALRAAQGMLLTTSATVAGTPHLQHDDLADLLARCEELTKALSAAVQRAGGKASTLAGQTQIGAAIGTWPRGAAQSQSTHEATSPVLAMHGREGVVIGTPASYVAYAGQHADIAADGNLHLASGDRAQLTAAQGATIHACNGGVDIVADQGPLVLRADHADALIDARDAIRLTSHDSEIVLSGRTIRLVAEDGSFLCLGNGIEIGTQGNYRIHADAPLYGPPKTSPRIVSGHAPAGTRQRVQMRYFDIDRASRPVAADHPYDATLPDGSLISGRTEANGMTQWMEAPTTDFAQVELGGDRPSDATPGEEEEAS